MNFCFPKSRGLLNKSARDDIKFRLNGLSEMMNKTLQNINHMNCLEDKNKIMTDLEIYLNLTLSHFLFTSTVKYNFSSINLV